jgi:hypothetical protein
MARERKKMPNTQKYIDATCEYRVIPRIRKGTPCEVDGRTGKIVGGNSSANFNVKFDEDGRISNCHPYWKMKIFDSAGGILYQHKDA